MSACAKCGSEPCRCFHEVLPYEPQGYKKCARCGVWRPEGDLRDGVCVGWTYCLKLVEKLP